LGDESRLKAKVLSDHLKLENSVLGLSPEVLIVVSALSKNDR
jgi:hypothetical protein